MGRKLSTAVKSVTKNFALVLECQCFEDFVLLRCLKKKTIIDSSEFCFLKLGEISKAVMQIQEPEKMRCSCCWSRESGHHVSAGSTCKPGAGDTLVQSLRCIILINSCTSLAFQPGLVIGSSTSVGTRTPSRDSHFHHHPTCLVRHGTTYYRISSTCVPMSFSQHFCLCSPEGSVSFLGFHSTHPSKVITVPPLVYGLAPGLAW